MVVQDRVERDGIDAQDRGSDWFDLRDLRVTSGVHTTGPRQSRWILLAEIYVC